jgi:hypothetical protein
VADDIKCGFCADQKPCPDHAPTVADSPLRFGFRRRCAWCGVVLRGWQLNRCRMCKRAILYSPSPPCAHASRWESEPDRLELRRG